MHIYFWSGQPTELKNDLNPFSVKKNTEVKIVVVVAETDPQTVLRETNCRVFVASVERRTARTAERTGTPTSAAGMPSGGRHCSSTSCSSRTSLPRGSCSKFFLRSAGGDTTDHSGWRPAAAQSHTHTYNMQSCRKPPSLYGIFHSVPLISMKRQSARTTHYRTGLRRRASKDLFAYTLKLTHATSLKTQRHFIFSCVSCCL